MVPLFSVVKKHTQKLIIDFRKYVSYHTHAEAIDGRACGGVSVMVKKTIPHRQIHLNTNLQAVAVSLFNA